MQYVEVATVEQIKEGEGKKVVVEGKSIALFKKGGEIFALSDTCAHRGGPLSEGIIDEGCVVCPWHNFDYDLRTGKSSQNCEVPTYEVKIADEKVFIKV